MSEVIQPGQKIKPKTGFSASLINAPDDYFCELAPKRIYPDQAFKGRYTWIQVFIKNKIELDLISPSSSGFHVPEGLFWCLFPKTTFKIQTVLTKHKVWDSVCQLKRILFALITSVWSVFCFCEPRPGANNYPRGMS